MKTLHVVVDADDIALGERNSGETCAVALALSRLFPSEGWEVCVSDVEAYLYPPGSFGAQLTAPLPVEARAFIEAFDAGAMLDPVAFDLTFDGNLTIYERLKLAEDNGMRLLPPVEGGAS